MLHPTIVYVDTLFVNYAANLIQSADSCGIKTIVICPPNSWTRDTPRPSRVIETVDFSIGNLRRIVSRLERRFEIRGFYCLFGPIRKEGFVHGNVSTLAAERKLSHNHTDALHKVTNKFLAREALSAAGLPNVRFGLATDKSSLTRVARSVGYPLILKPLTGVGSTLILKCNNEREALKNFDLALKELAAPHYEQLRMASHRFRTLDGRMTRFNPSRSMLVEQYIDGPEASVECVVVGDDVRAMVVHDKIGMQETRKVFFEHLLVSPPERFTRAEVARMRRYAVDVIRAIGLENMICHVELRYDKKAGPLLLEINPRIGAGCVRDSIEKFTVLDVQALELALVLGEASLPKVISRRAGRHALVSLFSPRSGILTEMSGLRSVMRMPEVCAVRVGHAVGDKVGGDSEEVFVATIFMKAANSKAAWESYERIKKLVRIRVKRVARRR